MENEITGSNEISNYFFFGAKSFCPKSSTCWKIFEYTYMYFFLKGSKLNEGLPDFFKLKYLFLKELLVHVIHYLVHVIEITQVELKMYWPIKFNINIKFNWLIFLSIKDKVILIGQRKHCDFTISKDKRFSSLKIKS